MKKDINVEGGGCFSFLLGLFLLLGVIYGISTPWGFIDINFFPPAIIIK
jgi:hypothetical protein